MAQVAKLNGTRFIRLQMKVASDDRSTGWIETYTPGIDSDQALEFATFQVERWNRNNPRAQRRLLGVRVFKKKIFGPWIHPEATS